MVDIVWSGAQYDDATLAAGVDRVFTREEEICGLSCAMPFRLGW